MFVLNFLVTVGWLLVAIRIASQSEESYYTKTYGTCISVSNETCETVLRANRTQYGTRQENLTPPGCYIHSTFVGTTEVYYNTNEESTTECSTYKKCVCKLESYYMEPDGTCVSKSKETCESVLRSTRSANNVPPIQCLCKQEPTTTAATTTTQEPTATAATTTTPDVNECASGNGGCSHECVNTVGGYHCKCPNGLLLGENNKTCFQLLYANYKDKNCSAETVWHSVGCYNLKPGAVRGKGLLYWRDDIEWAKHRIAVYGKSLVCACAEAARFYGAQYFGTHYWGECYAINMNDMDAGTDCKLADGAYNATCGNKNETFACLGDSSYYVYRL